MKDQHVIIAGTFDRPIRGHRFDGPVAVEMAGESVIKVEQCESPEHASSMALGMAFAYNADKVIDRFAGRTIHRPELRRMRSESI